MRKPKEIDPRDRGLILAILGPYFDTPPTMEEIVTAIEALDSSSKAAQTDALPDCLTVKQAADVLKVSTDTIRRRIKDGTISAVRVRTAVRILRSEIMRLLQMPDTRRIPPTQN